MMHSPRSQVQPVASIVAAKRHVNRIICKQRLPRASAYRKIGSLSFGGAMMASSHDDNEDMRPEAVIARAIARRGEIFEEFKPRRW
jgi:hypothetical protein